MNNDSRLSALRAAVIRHRTQPLKTPGPEADRLEEIAATVPPPKPGRSPRPRPSPASWQWPSRPADELAELVPLSAPTRSTDKPRKSKPRSERRRNGPRPDWKPLAVKLRALLSSGLTMAMAAFELGIGAEKARAILAEWPTRAGEG